MGKLRHGGAWGGRGAPGYAGSPRLSGAVWLRGETPVLPVLPVPGAGILMPAPPQRCSASCSPTWRAAWPGVTAPTGRPMTGTMSWPAPATPTVPSSPVRGTGDGAAGAPGWHRDRAARAQGTWRQDCWNLGDMGTWGHGEGVPEPGGHGGEDDRAQGMQGLGMGLPKPGGHGDMGTGMMEPKGRRDGTAGVRRCRRGCHLPLQPLGTGWVPGGGHIGCCLDPLPTRPGPSDVHGDHHVPHRGRAEASGTPAARLTSRWPALRWPGATRAPHCPRLMAAHPPSPGEPGQR